MTALCALLCAPAAASGAARFEIRGAGWGHGIGMSQYGAYGQAQQGRNYQQILEHYYRGTIVSMSQQRSIRVLLQASRSPVSFTGATRAGGAQPERELDLLRAPEWRRRSAAPRGRWARGDLRRPAARVELARVRSVARHGHQRRDLGQLPRRARAAAGHERRNHCRERGEPRQVRDGRRAGRDAVELAARGAEGAGGRGAQLCAGQRRRRRGLRPVPRHALAGLPRHERRGRVDERGGSRDGESGRDLQRRDRHHLLLLHLGRPHREHRERLGRRACPVPARRGRPVRPHLAASPLEDRPAHTRRGGPPLRRPLPRLVPAAEGDPPRRVAADRERRRDLLAAARCAPPARSCAPRSASTTTGSR